MKFNKKSLAVALSLFFGCSTFGQNNEGTLVTDPIRPFSVNSTNPSAIANEIKGGPFSSSNLVGLSNIPAPRLELGALGYAADTGLYYRLTATSPATWSSINGANITNVSLTNISGTLAISNGGSGATTAGEARTNFGLGNISTNTFQTTNTAVYINTNLVATNGTLTSTNIQSDYVESPYFLVGDSTNGIVFETTDVAAITRTNLGIGAGATNTVGFGKIRVGANNLIIEDPANDTSIITFPVDTDPVVLGADYWDHGSVRQSLGFSTNLSNFWASASIAAGRTNLGLPLAALTNTNNANFLAAFFGANTNPVLVNTNGEVVSPTNFWQVAPINTVLQNITNVVGNATNAATNARMLFLYSLAPTVTNVTSTITLPTNGTTFGGDVATITHLGPTSSVTAIRALGASTNIITLNQIEESVRFIYRDNQWKLMDNISYIEPIFFSGTNAAGHAAESRTNLGLGWLALTSPQSSLYSGLATTLLGYVPEINPSSSNLTGYNVLAYTNTNSLVIPANILIGADLAGGPRNTRDVELNGTVTIKAPLSSPTTVYANNSITATDNSSYTNVVVSFISNSVGFSNATVSGTLTATSTVTAKTNLVVEGFVDFSTNHTNVAPATNNQIQKFLQIRIGTNAFFLPLYQ